MHELNEWTFAADVCKTIQGILASNPELPFSEARVEEGAGIGRKRRDLTLYGRDQRSVLSGEIKLPDRPDGQSPYSDPLVSGAFEKANAKGLEYFFTWNVNKFVLWRTFEPGKPLAERTLEHFNVTSIARSDDILSSGVQTEIRGFLTQFLGRFARILQGTEPIRSRPLDEKFIRVLESALELPILQTRFAVERGYSAERRFARDLDVWMRDAQGWLLSNEPEILRENLERAAKFSCYVLVNKIVFHQALRRRFPTLRRIRIPESIKTAEKLHELLAAYFDEAKRISRDYETVFDGDFGDKLPFLDDATVSSWREFLREIEGFDFSKIEYDIIGHIFERLISPEERHRYGQHYTRSEIVDLINAFTIREPGATVLDPACGGGTFLVRAYSLKRTLSGGRLAHDELLQQIKGIDSSAYAAHLSTINLATRDLIDERNYPLVARSDFFKVRRDKPIFHIPLSIHGRGKQMTTLDIGEVDAIVGNPPYVRQELLSKERKERLNDLVEAESDAKLSGRSDLHCYFWPHATSFLKESGHYGFLTSSAWLDVEYGFHLQEWLLRHFAIFALFESNCEPWFTGARVTTVATLMRREADPAKRAGNTVRFVQLRKPLREVLDGFDSEPLTAARLLRDFVESQTENLLDDRWRIRVVNQHELWEAGCRDGVAGIPSQSAAATPPAQMATGSRSLFQGDYIGGKWGIYLRAPDVFFQLLDRCGPGMVPLGQLAEIRYGVKSGADDFFFVRDVTDEELASAGAGLQTANSEGTRHFREKWGIRPSDTDRVRIVEAGEGSRHLIEAKYLEPYVHGFMEIFRAVIQPSALAHKVLLIDEPPETLKGSHVLRYIRWGERQGYNERVTVKARSRNRVWYDLVPQRRGQIIWPKLQQYKHVVALNLSSTIVNCNLYDLFCREDVKPDLLAAVLNSSIVALARHQFGSFMGREGNQVTEVADTKMVLVPDPRMLSAESQTRVLSAFAVMCERDSRPLPEEFELEDRVSLDEAILAALGYSGEESSSVRRELYDEIRHTYREIRAAEVEMQKFRRATARRDNASPRTIAEEIWEEFDHSQVRTFPLDFVSPSENAESFVLPSGIPRVLHNLFDQGVLQINGNVIRLGSRSRAEFAAKTAELGGSGPTAIPFSDRTCEQALEAHRRYESGMESKFRELSEERSADPDVQARIVRELCRLLHASSTHSTTY